MIHKYRMENIQEGQIVFKDTKILRLGERIDVESNVRYLYSEEP